MTDYERIEEAIRLAQEYGPIDGGHHKAWVIDQMLRVLMGEDYDFFVAENDYWDTGIAP